MDVYDALLGSSVPDFEQAEHETPVPNAGDPARRRRARKACVECHKRKVRCDVLNTGSPCTNCRLDHLVCQLRPREQRRKNHASKRSLSHLTQQTVHEDEHTASRSVGLLSSLDCDEATQQTHISNGSETALPRPVPTTVGQSTSSTYGGDLMYSYYDFLEVESLSHLLPDDFRYLESKGCFHLPVREIVDECVRQYFLHVHPALPLLDEKAFWDMYEGDGRQVPRDRMSLFVFRSMIFVSSSFLPLEILKALGFQTPLGARSAMYQRAKLLYDFNTLADPISIAQGAVLLTYHNGDHEPMVNTSWLRLAIQYATAESAHQYDTRIGLSEKDRAVRKRLWWSCLIRDRILPLGVRRSVQINRAAFDFEQAPLTEDDLQHEFQHSRVYSASTKRALAKLLISLLDLVVKLTDVISLVYAQNSNQQMDNLSNDAYDGIVSQTQCCREALSEWSVNAKTGVIEIENLTPSHKSIILFRELTQIYFQSARAALCQYETLALQSCPHASSSERTRELGSELHEVVAHISESVGHLVRADVARYMPISMVAYMALPLVLNAIDVQGANTTHPKHESKRRQLRVYREAMDVCQARYPGTKAATHMYDQIIAAARDNVGVMAEDRTASTALMRARPTKIEDWFGAFVNQPLQYLRITFTIDMSLSSGKFPRREDLPKRLLITERGQIVPTIPRPLSRGDDENDAVRSIPAGEIYIAEDEMNLDFFDLASTTARLVDI